MSVRDKSLERSQTTAYINADPIALAIERPTKTASGDGGYLDTGSSTLPQQTFRITPVSLTTGTPRVTVDGADVTPDIWLVGHWDADLELDDEFVDDDGQRYKVVRILKRPSWRKSALAVALG